TEDGKKRLEDLSHFTDIAEGKIPLGPKGKGVTPSGASYSTPKHYYDQNLAQVKIAAGRNSAYDAMAKSKLSVPDVSALAPHHSSLLALEGARRPGMFAALSVAQELASYGVATGEEVLYGRLNPMRWAKAGVAGDQVIQSGREGEPLARPKRG